MKNKNPWLIKFGENIRNIRLERGLSQEKLAELSGLDRTYIGGIERGERNIAVINIIKIASALKVEIDELFSKIDSVKSKKV